MVGRGFRTSPGKEDCLVLDFGGNVRRHGPVDQVEPKPRIVGEKGGDAPTKTCPQCEAVVHAAFSICPNCQYEFPATEVKHDRTADTAPITSLETVRTDYDVIDVMYAVHRPRDGRTPSMRVDYRVNQIKWFSEWICFEHDGWAGAKAASWWRARSYDPVPETVEDAVTLANAGALAMTERITVQEKGSEKFPRIVKCKLGPMPERVEREETDFEFPVVEPEPVASDTSWIDGLPF
jgi:DNA repair protein RadD